MNYKMLTLGVITGIVLGNVLLLTQDRPSTESLTETGKDAEILGPALETTLTSTTEMDGVQNETTPARGVPESTISGAPRTNTAVISSPSTTPKPTTLSKTPTAAPSSAPSIATVYYDGSNFVPEVVTIVEGGTVVFENLSDRVELWVASNPHATHSRYPVKRTTDCSGSSFDQCASMKKGETWSFTFSEVGEWKYHNHLRSIDGGTVIVLTKKKYLEYEKDQARLQN